MQKNASPNEGHAQPQNSEVKNAKGLMTLPKKQPLVLTQPCLSPMKMMVHEMRLICMLATQVVVNVLG